MLNECLNVSAVLRTVGRKDLFFCVRAIALNEDQGVAVDQYRVMLQGLYKNPKKKVISMGIESFCWTNYPFFTSEAWQFFVSFLLSIGYLTMTVMKGFRKPKYPICDLTSC